MSEAFGLAPPEPAQMSKLQASLCEAEPAVPWRPKMRCALLAGPLRLARGTQPRSGNYGAIGGQIRLPDWKRLRYHNARELASAMELVRVVDLSQRISFGAGADRSGTAPALSTRLQSALAGPRAALRVRVLLLQRARVH